MIRNALELLARIRVIHDAIRDEVVRVCEQTAIEHLSTVIADQAGDTIFAIDRVSEQVLIEHFHTLSQDWSFVLIAEGLGETGVAVFPEGTKAEDAELRIIIDPIDGTRGLMYQKRPAWILTGVAPNRGEDTLLADVELALQTEIPLIKQHLSDTLWAFVGQGAQGERVDRLTGKRQPLRIQPSRANTLAQGYSSIARFFPGGRAELAAIDDAVIERVLGPVEVGKVHSFEDQYISTGGQLYELMMGHDRWLADFRPLVEPTKSAAGMCCHPYDLCTELIAREVGVIITDEYGHQLAAPLDVTSSTSWVGYANSTIQHLVAPALQAVLRQHGLLRFDTI